VEKFPENHRRCASGDFLGDLAKVRGLIDRKSDAIAGANAKPAIFHHGFYTDVVSAGNLGGDYHVNGYGK
jgi:hypothetical protein